MRAVAPHLLVLNNGEQHESVLLHVCSKLVRVTVAEEGGNLLALAPHMQNLHRRENEEERREGEEWKCLEEEGEEEEERKKKKKEERKQKATDTQKKSHTCMRHPSASLTLRELSITPYSFLLRSCSAAAASNSASVCDVFVVNASHTMGIGQQAKSPPLPQALVTLTPIRSPSSVQNE
jgi:hypothetical protein